MAATVALNLFAFRIITLNAEIFQNGNKRLEQTHHRGGKQFIDKLMGMEVGK